MKKMILVYNPVSGDASFKNKLDMMIDKFQQRGCMLLLYRTERDNSRSFGRFLRAANADGVIVSGGDGTLHEIINLLLKEGVDLPVGIMPNGTSNDFASFMGLADDLDLYIDTIVAGHSVPVDLGRVGSEYFINVASAGMLTSVAHEVDVRLKNAFGKMAYYLRGIGELPRFRALKLQIEADGEVFEERAFLFVVVNSSIVGSLKNVAVDAKVNDGKLDMVLLQHCSLPELMTVIAQILAGKSMNNTKNVRYLQAEKFVISCAEELGSDLDGERGPQLPLAIETLPGRLRLFYPADKSL
ncbi:MAG: YegS/Rv2252/BmrU family lipid kinase [Selenomonadaceae bacterium]